MARRTSGMPPKTAQKITTPRSSANSDGVPPLNSGLKSASRLVDQHIREIGGWRGETLVRMRELILNPEPEAIEEVKWRKPSNPAGIAVWSHNGIICTAETY